MSKDSVIVLKKPESIINDQIIEILRQGARKKLAQALEAEIDQFIRQFDALKDEHGRQRIVRNGYLPERTIQSGIGSVPILVPRARDRHPHASERIHFSSATLPLYLRRIKSIEELIPRLYLKGISTYDFPAEHWRNIRTSNPIESTFATVRLRTDKVRGCFSSQTVVTMAFRLAQCAEKRWIRLHHPEHLARVIRGVNFVNGIKDADEKRNAA